MTLNLKRANEAREYHQLQVELGKLTKDIRAFLESSTAATGAAARALLGRAQAKWERDTHFDIYGRVRPLEAIDRLFELGARLSDLGRTHPRTPEVDREQYELDREHTTLCQELGVINAIGCPDHHHVRAVARAVEAGASPTPDGRPEDWPPDQHWITDPPPWDPDWYVTLVIESYFTGEVMLAGMSQDDLRLCGLAVLLALDRDRSVFQEVMQMAGVEVVHRPEAGKTLSLAELRWRDCSPVRWWLSCRCFLEQNEDGVEPKEWALKSRWDLDEAVKVLGQTVLDLSATRSVWDAWIPAAMEILEEEPMGPTELQRRLNSTSFPTSKKARGRLSAVLRGTEAWPGRGRHVILAETVKNRLVSVQGWRARVDEVLGDHRHGTGTGSYAPF